MNLYTRHLLSIIIYKKKYEHTYQSSTTFSESKSTYKGFPIYFVIYISIRQKISEIIRLSTSLQFMWSRFTYIIVQLLIYYKYQHINCVGLPQYIIPVVRSHLKGNLESKRNLRTNIRTRYLTWVIIRGFEETNLSTTAHKIETRILYLKNTSMQLLQYQ